MEFVFINNQNQMHMVHTPFSPVGYREQRVVILHPATAFIHIIYNDQKSSYICIASGPACASCDTLTCPPIRLFCWA